MNSKKKILFIVNPISGGKSIKNIHSIVAQNLDGLSFDFEIYETQRKDDASLKVQAAKDQFDVIAVVGGDGTINEVAKSLVGTKTRLAIIPKGSGNGFANYFNIPSPPAEAIQRINEYSVHTIDTATFNGQYFHSVAGIGFDAQIAHKFDTFGTRGFWSYAWLTIKSYFSYAPKTYTIAYDGIQLTQKAFLVTIANSNQFGNNAIIAPQAKIDDGLLDLIIIKPFPMIKLGEIIIRIFKGTIHQSAYCLSFTAKKISILCDENPAQLDGEPINGLRENVIEIVPQSLNLII